MIRGRGLRFGVLGQLEIVRDTAPVIIASPKQRIALATLLLQANKFVTKGELADRIWENGLPANVCASLHTHMSRLRQALGDDGSLIMTRDSGYSVFATEETLDILRFRNLVSLAAEARRRGDIEHESRMLREALALWRGPALADVDSESLQCEVVPALERERTRAQERWFDVAIGRGEPAEVIVDLESAVDAHPTHERFWAQLILARSQAGRPAEALQTYQTARKVLAAELGIDPGPEIQQAYERISKGAAVPSASARAREAQTVSDLPKPAELPADNGAFTGRATELGRLRTRLTSSRPRPVVAITGLGGVGKSALAIHVAHQIADDFPDGQLYVDLYGSTPGRDPLQPLEVLGRFLRSFGLANPAIPASVDEAAARFRSVTGRRRVLVVLDNARDVHQIRPLIPGGPGCGVVVTCRRSLASLVNVEQCHLDVLSQEEAGLLLSRLVGRERVETEREAAAAVVRLCGGLPVKLCVAAARLTARPEETFDALRDRLAMEQGRLPATATA